MRKVVAKCKTNNMSFDLSRDVEIICEVMERGRAIDAITFELELNGKELISFIKEFKLEGNIKVSINENDEYILIAYDW